MLDKVTFGYGRRVEALTTALPTYESDPAILDELHRLDTISNFAAFVVCIYLLTKILKCLWEKRKAALGTKNKHGVIESPSGLKILLKIGTPEVHETVCLQEFLTKMDDQTFFEVPHLLSLIVERACLKYSLKMIDQLHSLGLMVKHAQLPTFLKYSHCHIGWERY